MRESIQRNRLYWLIASISIIVLSVVWFIHGLIRVSELSRESNISMRVPNPSEENLVQLTSENTSKAFIEGVEIRNRRQAEAANKRGASHVDRLVNGIQTVEAVPRFDMEWIKNELKGLSEAQADLVDKMNKMDRQRSQRSSTQRSPLPYYFAQTGVEHFSEALRQQESEAIERAFDFLVTSTGSQPIGSIVSTGSPVNVREGSPAAIRPENERRFRPKMERTRASLEQKDPASSTLTAVIPAHGRLLHARLNLGLNSEIGGIASATIVGGQHHGVVMSAKAYTAKHRHLAINFDRFCTAQSLCGDIRAVAVDLDQGVAAIRGEYHGNYGIRFSGAVAASIIEGYGRAVSSGLGNNSLIIDGRLISTQSQEVNSRQAIKASALEAGTSLGQFFREFAQRPPRVEKEIDQLIGIYVISPGVLTIEGRTVSELSSSERPRGAYDR